VYVLNSKHRESLATFLIPDDKFGPQGGVAGAAPRALCPAGAFCAASQLDAMTIKESANTNRFFM
jgi:hypothetical protein